MAKRKRKMLRIQQKHPDSDHLLLKRYLEEQKKKQKLAPPMKFQNTAELLKPKPMYYTETGTQITARLESGKTKFFYSELEAERYASKNRSYKYQVFDAKGKHAGYAVPK